LALDFRGFSTVAFGHVVRQYILAGMCQNKFAHLMTARNKEKEADKKKNMTFLLV
jgi:hypothetical protein